MRSSYSSYSRLYRKRKVQLYRRISVLLTLSVLLIIAIFALGLPLLVRVSLFLDSFKGASEPVQTPDAQIVLPPRLMPSYEATNSATISLDGFGSAGETIEIFVNDKKVAKVIAVSDGSFRVSEVELSEGDNKITAIATSLGGKKSEESAPLNVLYKKTPPSLEVENPADGASVSGENKEIMVSGKTDTDSRVFINERMIIVSPEGKFSSFYTLSDGMNSIKIVAVDKAGNKTEVERKANYNP